MSEEKRAPLLTLLVRLFDENPMIEETYPEIAEVRAKITSGELMVVRTAGVELVPNDYDCMLTCTGCKDGTPYYLLEEFDEMNFCPNCGAKIIKP